MSFEIFLCNNKNINFKEEKGLSYNKFFFLYNLNIMI